MPIPKTKYILWMCEFSARHMRALGRKPDCTAEDIADKAESIDQAASWMYNALAYFKERGFYHSFDEVDDPQEGQHIYIRRKGSVDGYIYRSGEWVDVGGFDTYS